jgi:hypothetical protein
VEEDTMRRSLTVLFVAAAAVLLSAQATAPASPFTGSWTLDLSASKLPPPLPRSQSTHIVVDADGVRVREEVETGAGEHLVITGEAKFDGRDYSVFGAPWLDTVAYTRVNARQLKGVAKKDGKVIVNETVTVSEDGRTLTGTYSGTDPTGKPVTGTAVFRRQVM